jgi:Rrf2 family nitric oxide-sensitive transcriptional repressor
MRITRYTDYSLRVLIYVALKGEEQSTIQEIADSYGISKNHLMKVVQALNSQGYLITSRGKNGGLRLNGDAGDINIGTLIRDTEQDFALVECFSNAGACAITPACLLKNVLGEALESFFAVLDQYTLADLLPHKQRAALLRHLAIQI